MDTGYSPTEGQRRFLDTEADVAIFGGTAGCGKTTALLMAAIPAPDALGTGVVFRRLRHQAQDALWDAAHAVYSGKGARADAGRLQWIWPGGAKVQFDGLRFENDVHRWAGSDLRFVGIDEAQSFTEHQFWYMRSRCRTISGPRPKLRATCTASPGSWVADLISWWIDRKTGLPIPDRSGVLRWYSQTPHGLCISEDKDDLTKMVEEKFGDFATPVWSMTFIPAWPSENTFLDAADPTYLHNLLSLPADLQQSLVCGSWIERERRWA